MKYSTESFYDISPLLHPKTAVWPGDTPLSRKVLCDIQSGSNFDLSSIETTVHIGSHADAPRHYHKLGKTIESVDLKKYIGPCEVVTVSKKSQIEVDDCVSAVEKGSKRILFRTLSFPDPDVFNTDFCSFQPDAIEFMGKNGVVLVGIDTPSVDPFDNKELASHQFLMRYDMANLEGIVLAHVPDGIYELIALPLKLAGFDASPVRAILRKLSSTIL